MATAQVTEWDATGKPIPPGATSPASPVTEWDASGKPIISAPAAAPATTPVATTPPPAAAPTTTYPTWKRYAAAGAETLPPALATAGGIIGTGTGAVAVPGVGGPIGGVTLAGLGGMTGETLKNEILARLGYPVPPTLQGQLKDISWEGLKQAGWQMAGEVPGAIGSRLKSSAEALYGKALAPSPKFKFTAQQVIPEAIERRVSGSLESLQAQAEKQLARLNPELDIAYAKAPKTPWSGQTIINDLEKLKDNYRIKGVPGRPDLPADADSAKALRLIKNLQDHISQFIRDPVTGQPRPELEPEELRQIKGIYDKIVAKSGGYAGKDLVGQFKVEAQRAAANSIRDIMAQASPDVARLNKEITFWIRLQDIAESTAERRVGQLGGWQKLLPGLTTVAGALTGAHRGGTLDDAVVGYVAGKLTQAGVDIMRSPAWQTFDAVQRGRLADILARGDVAELVRQAGRWGIQIPSLKEAAKGPRGEVTVTRDPLYGRDVSVIGAVPGGPTGQQ